MSRVPVLSYLLFLLETLAKKIANAWHIFLLINGNSRMSGGAKLGTGVKLNSVQGLHVGPGLKVGANTRLLLDQVKNKPKAQVFLGKNVKLGDQNQVGAGPGQTLRIGDETSTHSGCYLYGDVSIGRYCLLSANIFISSGEHFYKINPVQLIKDQDMKARAPGSTAATSVLTTIEDDCWIGWGTVITQGVTIGKGCIVGANSVVTKDLPPYSIAVGAPAKVIKSRIEYAPSDVLEAGNLNHHPYLHHGFSLRERDHQKRDGKSVLTFQGEALVALPAQSVSQISLHFFAPEETTLEICFNGHTLQKKAYPVGWHEIQISCPSEAIHNKIELHKPLAAFHQLKLQTPSAIEFHRLQMK